MLGRKNYTPEEIDHAKATIGAEVAAYKALASAVSGDKKAGTALATFEPLFFNNLVLALDRPFVHRVRAATGKDGNAVNEVEIVCESLMNNGGILQESSVLKLDPERSVLGLAYGDAIQLSADQFDRLAAAFFEALEERFL